MADTILISENYYTARSKTIKILILSKLTNETNAWEIMLLRGL
jgi:hypothetical protein